MLIFTDKGKLRKRIKELEEALRESEYNEGQLRKQVNRLVSEITSMDYQHEQDEERWAEKLESYEESLKRRDLTIAEIKEEESERYAGLYDKYIEVRKLLDSFTGRCFELNSENTSLKVEINGAEREIERLKEQSKSPYPTVTINVDVRDTLAKQLAKSLKQANEAFEKRYKKKYVFTQTGSSDHYECSTLDELLNELKITYWIKEADLNNIREEYESLEEIFNEEGKAYTTLSFFSIEYNSRIRITAAIIKEEI